MAYVRKFKTTSGATGVQICYKEAGRVVKTVHVGSAASEKGIAALEKKARKMLAGDAPTLFDLDKYNKK